MFPLYRIIRACNLWVNRCNVLLRVAQVDVCKVLRVNLRRLQVVQIGNSFVHIPSPYKCIEGGQF